MCEASDKQFFDAIKNNPSHVLNHLLQTVASEPRGQRGQRTPHFWSTGSSGVKATVFHISGSVDPIKYWQELHWKINFLKSIVILFDNNKKREKIKLKNNYSSDTNYNFITSNVLSCNKLDCSSTLPTPKSLSFLGNFNS